MTAEDIIALAKTQVGVSEDPPGSNNIIYNTVFYGGPSNLPWCVVFIWWLFRELGASDLFCGGNKTAYCGYVKDWAVRNNQWVTDSYRPGDLVLFDWNSDGELDHIGLVAEVHGNALTTIEGNESDKVTMLTRSGISMVGAYRPKYTTLNAPQAPTSDVSTPADKYTVHAGDTLTAISVRYGTTVDAIVKASGISDPNRIWVGQVLTIPGKSSHRTVQITVKNETLELLTVMADGWGKTIGEVIDTLTEGAK